ncbi:hypothetical protein ABW19_dt0207395 [Dactylella cylindrospora]|nr:hypothetical protein ABW19_dt0207395 [Dactylella cylindrospora]
MATDGIIAVNKPPNRTSAQLLRSLQDIFKSSTLFQEHIESQKQHAAYKDKVQSFTRQNRRRRENNVRVGHGGTLDPMATGVLIVGVGRGTKQLNKYLDCTKEYEAVAIFGASTDTYDQEGKITWRKPYGHITREVVEGVLDKFRGDIFQKPPMYVRSMQRFPGGDEKKTRFSALSLNGKRLYEYAREGIPVPVEIKKRPCNISNLEIIKFEDGKDGHEWEYPVVEASEVEKAAAEMYANMGLESKEGSDGGLKLDPATVDDAAFEAAEKRKADDQERKVNKKKRRKYDPNNLPGASGNANDGEKNEEGQEEGSTPPPPPEPVYHEGVKPPVVHLRMTVSRGTYVRSVVHDIGQEIGSAAHLVALKRTRQGEYALGDNVIEWEDFDNGNDAWEEKVKKELLKQQDF